MRRFVANDAVEHAGVTGPDAVACPCGCGVAVYTLGRGDREFPCPCGCRGVVIVQGRSPRQLSRVATYVLGIMTSGALLLPLPSVWHLLRLAKF